MVSLSDWVTQLAGMFVEKKHPVRVYIYSTTSVQMPTEPWLQGSQVDNATRNVLNMLSRDGISGLPIKPVTLNPTSDTFHPPVDRNIEGFPTNPAFPTNPVNPGFPTNPTYPEVQSLWGGNKINISFPNVGKDGN